MWTHFQNFLQFWFWDRNMKMINAIYTFVPFVELNPMQVARIEVRCEDISTAYQIIHILYYGLILHPHNSVEIPPKIKIALFCFWLFVCLTFILTIFFFVLFQFRVLGIFHLECLWALVHHCIQICLHYVMKYLEISTFTLFSRPNLNREQ